MQITTVYAKYLNGHKRLQKYKKEPFVNLRLSSFVLLFNISTIEATVKLVVFGERHHIRYHTGLCGTF